MQLVKRTLSVAGFFITVIGAVLLIVCASALIHRLVFSHLALHDFDSVRATLARRDSRSPVELLANQRIDFSLWSNERIQAFDRHRWTKASSPLAVLQFKRLGLRIPVFEGTDDLTLNRGAGWIRGTTRPGEMGNIGIAGHRDSFFRMLKDTEVGEAIELSTVFGMAAYTVDHTEIVAPEDVAVLRPGTVPSLTLVTCYPFYFVGEAPQRFIVHAALNAQVLTYRRPEFEIRETFQHE